MAKKLLALALVLLMVVPMIASCGKVENQGSNEGQQGGNAVNTKPNNGFEISEEEQAIFDSIDEYVGDLAAKNNFSGETFTWIGGGSQAPTTDEETGDILSDALYYRQRDIESLFGITWENYQPEQLEGSSSHPVVDAVVNDVMAGTGAYDAGYGTPVAVCLPMFQRSALADINTFNGVDFEQEWWTATILDTYHINGATYFVNGAIVTSNYQDTCCVIYNKDVQTNYNIEELYPLVESGEWTFDKMLEIASVIPANTNGNAAYRFSEPNGMAVIYANGYTITKFNDDTTPYVEENLPIELSNLSDKFAPVFGDDTLCVNAKGVLSGNYENIEEKYGKANENEMFVDDEILFHFVTTGGAAELREEEVTFGILPLPKREASQENYVSYAEPWAAFNVFVPKTTTSTEVTGVVIEAMAALGRKHIKPAYYDNLLRSRATYDYESQAMIDIIFNTKVYELIDFLTPDGDNNSDSSFVKILKGSIQETNQGIASKYKMQAKLVNKNIESKVLTQVGK